MDKNKLEQELNQLILTFGKITLTKEEYDQRLSNIKINLEHIKSQIAQCNRLLIEQEPKTD